ncbi:hypothetical protein [Natronorubrum sp. FCH18a]|uniref:hypothetical protein n=1 Tax=Natronorubrum sp. FCH18a TaxID=3447018 RepID=UPI003F518317
MIADLENRVDQLTECWDAEVAGREIRFEDEVTSENLSQLFSDITDFRSQIHGRNLILEIEYQSGAFTHRLIWESMGSVICRQESDSDAAPDDLFADGDAQTAIDEIRNNSISNTDDLQSAVSSLLSTDLVECSFQYAISAEHLENHIEGVVEEDLTVSYYFTENRVKDEVEQRGLSGIKDYLYAREEKRLIAIRDVETPLVGSQVAIFPPREIGSNLYDSFIDRRSLFDEQLKKVRKECAIDYFEEQYLPPGYLDFNVPDDTEFSDWFCKRMTAYRLMFCLLGLSNIARRIEDGWRVRFNGRRVIESTIHLKEENGKINLQEENTDEDPIEVDEKTTSELSDLFEWIYTTRTTDRITVFRNIVTLYSTTLIGAIREINEVSESVKSNFNFYIQDSIEEFVETQQDVSEYVFETHREMSDIRRSLSNNLSRDLFRVFVFAVISWVGIISQLGQIARIRYALAVSLIPVCVYLGLGLRTAYSLDKQFESIDNGREQYYSMYEGRIDDQTMKEIRNADAGEAIEEQFKTDLQIYYLLFGAMIAVSLYAIVDLAYLDYIVTDFLEALLSE